MANGDVVVSGGGDITPPTSPTSLAANVTSTSSITVTWNPATDNIAVIGYIVERCQGSGCSNFTQVGIPSASPFVDSGLTANTLYNYHVRATDAAGNLSGWSNVVIATTPEAPPVSQNLILGFSFNEGTGTTTQDVSGHNHVGTLSGATWTSQGKNGNAVVFNGSSSVVSVPDTATIDLTGDMTLSAWIYPTDGTRAWQDLIVKTNTSGNCQSNYYFVSRDDESLLFSFCPSGSWRSHQTPAGVLTLNTWNFVSLTFSNTTDTIKIFVNGTERYSGTETASPVADTNPVNIGGGWSGEEFSGRIDDVRIYNTALTQTEIQTDMNTPLTQGGTGTFSPCNTVTTANFSQSAYNAYGAPFDAFQTSTNLINATCSSSDSHTIQATLGQTGDTTRIVYTKGYYYANNAWTQYSGTCTGAQNGDWCQGSVSATITNPNISTASASAPAYFVGMTCSVQGGSWRCGCRDTACNNFYWMIQGAGQ